MSIDLSGIIQGFTELYERMQALRLTSNLGLMISKFTNLPTVEISTSSTLSDLIQMIGENASEAAGTLVQPQGSAPVVVLNMQQYETIKKVLGAFPEIVKGINARLELSLALRKFGAEILGKTSEPLSAAVGFLVLGIGFTIIGAFWLGTSFQKSQKEEKQQRYWDYILPAMPLALGIICTTFSAIIITSVEGNCRQLAQAFGKTPL